jgi:hypothetical protein
MQLFDREHYRVGAKPQKFSDLYSDDNQSNDEEVKESPLKQDLDRAVRRIQVFTGLFSRKPRYLQRS